MKKKTVSMLTVVVLVLLAFSTFAKADVLYVKPDGLDSNSGTSWADAFATIQAAIDEASAGDEIWVKEGTYTLTTQINVNKAVAIYGGFAGTETERHERDWENNVTTVDGNNSYRCFYVTADARIDGFTITGGDADGSWPDNTGGGVYLASSATIANCIFSNNSAAGWGGGIYIYSPSFGGPYPPPSPPASSNFPAITNCTFSGNTAGIHGGGIWSEFSYPTISNCIFSGNTATQSGGGICNSASSSTITNCTFFGNSANDGGGIFNDTRSSGTAITNCILWGDTPQEIRHFSGNEVTTTYCDVQGGFPGMGSINTDPLFVNAAGDDFHLTASSPCIDAGTNTAVIDATDLDGAPRIVDGDNDSMPTVDMGAYEYQIMMWTLVNHLGGSFCVTLQYVEEDQYRLSYDAANLVYEGLYAVETGEDVLDTYLVMTVPDNPAYNGFVWEITTGTMLLIQHCYVDLCCYDSCANCDEGIPCCYLPATMTLGCVEGPCAGLGGDTDGDGVCDDGDGSGTVGDNPCTGGNTDNCDDNCPDVDNADQTDTDEDEIGDDCDPCPYSPDNDIDLDGLCGDAPDNCPYDHNPNQEDRDGDGVGDICDNCKDTPNPGQEDTDEDLLGDACDLYVANLSVTSTGPTFSPGEPIWVTAKLINYTGVPQRTIKPNCFTCGPGPLFTVSDKDGNILRHRYTLGPPIVIPGDVITIYDSYSITCDLSQMFLPTILTDPTPADQLAEDYTVVATFMNHLSPPDYTLWTYAISTGEQTVSIEGTAVETFTAQCSFDPAQWYAHWAVADGPDISVQISSSEFNVAGVNTSTILLNGQVGIIGSDGGNGDVLTVRFDALEAVQSVGASVAGTVDVVVQGKAGDNYFRAQCPVEIRGNLMVQFDKHTVACGTHPGSTKEPIQHRPVKIFPKAQGSCAASCGISWHHYPDIWSNCTDLVAEATTNDDGQAVFVLPPGDYLVIAEYDPDESETSTGDELYIGRSVGDFTGDILREKYVQVIENSKNKNVPAKYRKLKGSELLIIEPEYVEWSGESELYPFVFDSIGDWAVTTSVAPPEGFVADYKSLAEEVNTELEAIQFTITDVGSKWKPTKVKHKIKHKGKTKKIVTEIGVKLAPGLAKKKGVSVYGE